MTNNELEPTVRALRQLSPQSQSLVASTVRQLAERDGVDSGVADGAMLGLGLQPTTNIRNSNTHMVFNLLIYRTVK